MLAVHSTNVEPYRTGGVAYNVLSGDEEPYVHETRSLCEAARCWNEFAIRHFVGKGCSINERDEDGRTPFHHLIEAASGVSDLEILAGVNTVIRYCFRLKADVNAQDKDGNVPICPVLLKKRFGILEICLRAGVRLNIPNKLGQRPMDLMPQADLIKGLRLDSDRVLAFHSMGKKIPADLVDDKGKTFLHRAVRLFGQKEISLCLDDGIPVDVEDLAGCTPLFDAVFLGSYKNANHVGDQKAIADVVRLLIQRNANASHRDKNGRTVLFCCVQSGAFFLIEILANAGADIFEVDQRGYTFLDIAQETLASLKGQQDQDSLLKIKAFESCSIILQRRGVQAPHVSGCCVVL